jgi:hypothetical protein
MSLEQLSKSLLIDEVRQVDVSMLNATSSVEVIDEQARSSITLHYQPYATEPFGNLYRGSWWLDPNHVDTYDREHELALSVDGIAVGPEPIVVGERLSFWIVKEGRQIGQTCLSRVGLILVRHSLEDN